MPRSKKQRLMMVPNAHRDVVCPLTGRMVKLICPNPGGQPGARTSSGLYVIVPGAVTSYGQISGFGVRRSSSGRTDLAWWCVPIMPIENPSCELGHRLQADLDKGGPCALSDYLCFDTSRKVWVPGHGVVTARTHVRQLEELEAHVRALRFQIRPWLELLRLPPKEIHQVVSIVRSRTICASGRMLATFARTGDGGAACAAAAQCDTFDRYDPLHVASVLLGQLHSKESLYGIDAVVGVTTFTTQTGRVLAAPSEEYKWPAKTTVPAAETSRRSA